MTNSLPLHEDSLGWREQLADITTLPTNDGHSIETPHNCSWCEQVQIMEESSNGRTLASKPLLRPQHVLEAARKGCLFYKWVAAHLCRTSGVYGRRGQQIQDDDMPFLTLEPDAGSNSKTLEAVLKFEWEPLRTLLGPGAITWTHESDPAAAFVSRRPPQVKADENTMGFGRVCLQNCLESHDRCRLGYTGNITGSLPSVDILSLKDAPTRLLHIRDNGGELHARIVDVCHLTSEQSEHLRQAGYVTLSYCWGKDQPLKLTSGIESTLKSGFPSSMLPRTLRDAVWVSNFLGRQFIWIDALCIFQDSSSDKAVEIANMARHYSKSTLTICAASAADCDGGLFQKHSGTSIRSDFGPIQLGFKSKSGEIGHIYLSGELAQTQEPLTTRAWTFQETMLSRRMLIFGTNELHWSCKAEHGSQFSGLYQRISGGPDTVVNGIDSLEGIRCLPPWHQWRLIVHRYSSRMLGVPADKLPAVSALASVLQDGSDTRYEYSEFAPLVYVAGLYITPDDCQSWVDALLWRIIAMTPSTRCQPYRAPSWSWASVDGHVMQRPPQHSDRADEFAVKDYSVRLNNKMAPYGMVDDAFLSIQARYRTLNGPLTMEFIFALDNDDDLPLNAYQSYVSSSKSGFIVIYPDTMGSRGTIEKALKGTGAVVLVELVKLPPSGLVLYPKHSPHNSQKSATYERIGCFVYKSTDWDWWRQNRSLEDMESVFGAAPVKSLVVI